MTAPPPPPRPVFLLDLDKSSMYGQDSNDLLTIAQSAFLCPYPGEDQEKEGLLLDKEGYLISLAGLLLNPAMIHTMRTLLGRYPDARVCIYTMKGGILKGLPPTLLLPPSFTPAATTQEDDKKPKGQHCYPEEGDERYIPSHMSATQCLALGVPRGKAASMERLFIARAAIQSALGLNAPPEIIITGMRKSVRRVCATVLLDPPADHHSAFLWDDLEEIANDYHVLRVPEYNAIPSRLAEEVENALERLYPQLKLQPPPLKDDEEEEDGGNAYHHEEDNQHYPHPHDNNDNHNSSNKRMKKKAATTMMMMDNITRLINFLRSAPAEHSSFDAIHRRIVVRRATNADRLDAKSWPFPPPMDDNNVIDV